MQTHIHTNTKTHMHSSMHALTHSQTNSPTRTHKHSLTYTHTCTHMQTCKNKHPLTHTHATTHTHTCKHIENTHTHACMHSTQLNALLSCVSTMEIPNCMVQPCSSSNAAIDEKWKQHWSHTNVNIFMACGHKLSGVACGRRVWYQRAVYQPCAAHAGQGIRCC